MQRPEQGMEAERPGRLVSGQTDGKGWRARPRGRKWWGEEAAKGQEQMRAALWPQKMEMEVEGVKE